MKRKRRFRRKEYKHDHVLAKLLMFGVQTMLNIGIWMVYPPAWPIILLVQLKDIGYYFGVNTFQYFIESILHHKHKTDIL